MKLKSILFLTTSFCLLGMASSCSGPQEPEADAEFHFGPGPQAEEHESTKVE